MTPGRIVSLDALTGMTVAAKIRKSKNQALADLVEFCMFHGRVADGAAFGSWKVTF